MGKSGRMRAFLVEFVIMLLFFSIASVITLQLFLNADKKSAASAESTKALIRLTNIAEEIKANRDYMDSLFSRANGWENGIRFYDSDWNICKEEKAFYQIEAIVTKEEQERGILVKVELVASHFEKQNEKNKEIMRIAIHDYLPDWRQKHGE